VVSTNTRVEESSILSINTVSTFTDQHYSIKVTSITSGYEGSMFQNYPGSSYVTNINFDVYKKNKFFDSGQVKYITDFKWGQTYTTTYINRGVYEELFIAPRAKPKPSKKKVQKQRSEVPMSDIEKKYEEKLERELMKRKSERGKN
jgi:hypothetical protein